MRPEAQLLLVAAHLRGHSHALRDAAGGQRGEVRPPLRLVKELALQVTGDQVFFWGGLWVWNDNNQPFGSLGCWQLMVKELALLVRGLIVFWGCGGGALEHQQSAIWQLAGSRGLVQCAGSRWSEEELGMR